MAGQGEGRGLKERIFEALGCMASPHERIARDEIVAPSANAPDAAEEATPPWSESERLARFLASELRLPLAALVRLGGRCAAAADPELAAVGRALAREGERLDVLVTNTLELGLLGEEPAARGRVDLQELVEKVIAGHRALVEGLAIRVRVSDSSRAPFVAGDRSELLECFSALFSDLLERVPRRGSVAVRVRELHGFARIDGSAPEASAPLRGDRTTMLRARELIERQEGEVWELSGSEQGFGLTLPLHGGAGPAPRVARRPAVTRPRA